MPGKGFCRFFSALVVVMVCTGCASKLPQTLPLTPAELQEAQPLLSSFLQTNRPMALDADIRLGWDVLGRKGSVGAILQLRQPAFVRFSANDPLDRALLIVVSDGTSFTMVDNRIGHIYQGRTDSKFWHSYVPEPIQAKDLFFFLGGFLPQMTTEEVSSFTDVEKTGFWYVWKDKRSLTHYVLLDRRTGVMRRHLLLHPDGDVVLELTYLSYHNISESGFRWPQRLQVTGSAITGTLNVHTQKIFSHTQLPAALFHLVLPAHYTVEQVP
jgi:hypothetical protein